MLGATAHLVLIDDDPDMHDVVRMIFPQPGYRVHCANTADSGLALVRRELPDLLLLDVMLATPTEGFAVAEQVKDDPRTAAVPIILISSAALDDGLPPTAVRFLEKPLDPLGLRQTVLEVLNR